MGTAETAHEVPKSAADQRAFSRIVDRFRTGVYDYLCWLTQESTLAADLTAETFVQIWRHPPARRHPGSLRAWVYTVALNTYRQHLRRRRLPEVGLDQAAEAVATGDEAPLSVFERAELQEAVRDAVAALPGLYRAVVVLHSIEGLTLREVAEALEVPLGTAKSRLATAFGLLRRSLQAWKGDDR